MSSLLRFLFHPCSCLLLVYIRSFNHFIILFQYCCNFDLASELLAEYNADPEKKALLARSQASINAYTNSWDLGSFLIKPFQLILKYEYFMLGEFLILKTLKP